MAIHIRRREFIVTLGGAAVWPLAAREGLNETGFVEGRDVAIESPGSHDRLRPWQGDVLDGRKNYKLHLPKDVPVNNFWSVTVYDNQTRSMIQTDQQFPSVSSQRKGHKVNANGSVDVYFGPKAPTGGESNWVQTIPGKSWNSILRLYGPEKPFFDKT